MMDRPATTAPRRRTSATRFSKLNVLSPRTRRAHDLGLGLRGLNAYAMRVGGAQHLKAHLHPGLSHDALRRAGVWADDAMANYYGGRSIEAFLSHARLMVQPTAVLPQF